MNTKASRVLFVNKCEEIVLGMGGKFIEETPSCDGTKRVFSLATNDNNIKIIIFSEEDHKLVYTVYMMFDKVSHNIGNPYSGKHNFHNGDRNVKDAIKTFELFLKNAVSTLNLP